MLEHTTFMQRRHAALTLAQSGELDGDIALSYVLWPTSEDLPRDLNVLKQVVEERLRKRCYWPGANAA